MKARTFVMISTQGLTPCEKMCATKPVVSLVAFSMGCELIFSSITSTFGLETFGLPSNNSCRCLTADAT